MANPEVEFNAWIRRYHPSGAAKGRVVCFPHAGGSATYYHPLSQRIAPDVDVIALQYPGRQDRRHEACITDIGVLADRITEQLLRLDDTPTLFFGHSMGATLAFEVAWRLEQADRNAPRRLVVSSRNAPGIARGEKIHERDDAGIIAEVRSLNGTGSAMLADTEILLLAIPAIRGDYQAIETYSYTQGRILQCPITAFAGDSDPRAEIKDVDAWRQYTESDFHIRIFTGGHFYLASHVPAIAAEITSAVDEMTSKDGARDPSPVGPR